MIPYRWLQKNCRLYHLLGTNLNQFCLGTTFTTTLYRAIRTIFIMCKSSYNHIDDYYFSKNYLTNKLNIFPYKITFKPVLSMHIIVFQLSTLLIHRYINSYLNAIINLDLR